MEKLFLLAALLAKTQTLFPCMTPTMSLDDTAIGNKSSGPRNQNAISEPSSPVDTTILMPESSAALRLYVTYSMGNKRQVVSVSTNSQKNQSTTT